jgi:hypothetical protein
MSENKQKTDFITVFATGIISQEKKDYTQDAMAFAKVSAEDLNRWVINDRLFSDIYSELQRPITTGMTLQTYMEYVQGLRNNLLNRPDTVEVQFTSEIN